MDDFLTPISTTTVKRQKDFKPSTGRTLDSNPESVQVVFESPTEVLKALREQPSLDTVGAVIYYLADQSDKPDGFCLTTPGPIQAQIVDTFVTSTIPDYWQVLKGHARYARQLCKTMRNANGLGAIMGRLRPLIADMRQRKPVDQMRDSSTYISDLLEALEYVIIDDQTSAQIWDDIRARATNPIQQKLMWTEYVSQTTSGRLLSLVAEAEDVLKQKQTSRKPSWLANGSEYASWLGRNIVILMKRNNGIGESTAVVTEICSKVLMLGYTDHVVAAIINSLIEDDSIEPLKKFLPKMKFHEQRKYLNSILSFVTKKSFGWRADPMEDVPLVDSTIVSAGANLIHTIIKDNEPLKDHLVSALTHSNTPGLDDSLTTRRSIVAALALDDEKLHNLMEKSLKLFGDSFFIAHNPILQQEALAQTLALTCGYVHRLQPMFLTMMAKSSYHVTGMSNRIAATSPRARFLGMAVGVAISKMVDKAELQLEFDLEGDEAIEAKWYQRLTQIDDKMGNLDVLKSSSKAGTKGSNQVKTRHRQAKGPVKPPTRPAITEMAGPRFVEILDNSSDEDEDLMPYQKPDSDPEDDADDPTMIDRNKPTAPVYIRDLITSLRDQGNYDRHQLALSTAASLIRRKAGFGSEVTDHIEELASILTNLNDNLDLPQFNEHRQQALIAVLLAKPGPMAQWFARNFFSGDYSLAQRIAMLTTLGLGAREVAGLKDSSTEDLIPPKPSFPSKTLPSHLHTIYATDSNPVTRITFGLEKQILSPIAASAADQITGPNILKVRTFSSRMEVEKRRSKPIPNALAQIVADNFFFPLTGRWWIHTRSSAQDSIYTSTHLLPPFLHTLALLLHASGPNTLSLPQMTREFWELLLSVRGVASNDKGVLSALLFALLMLLEANEDKERLATEQGRELLETQEWVRMVFQGLGAGSEEDERVRVLAAGVVIRCQEVVEKYQRRLVGSMMDY
ncbi:hypothetical protein CC78DRAFT_611526 [Lojkania enalia]|uniref:Telomere length regulation protein conserved domain-containing protein n=1 Tax=Lojkania enalia TaxID=147567 RepID=A0A9P4NCI9_9PLEO|nr:hypothetical protein CC78DRAFT_611526 [Didymosphaeria enalia]